jgi:hypothetical protein
LDVPRVVIEDVTRALREQSPAVLGAALDQLLVEGEEEWLKDWRDLLVALAPYHDCARRLGLDPAAVFGAAADRGPAALREIVGEFGRRNDISPRTFGYDVVEGPNGPRYEIDFSDLPFDLGEYESEP